MAGFGFNEAINYSFIHPESPDRLRLAAEDARHRTVVVRNPISEDQAVMRTSLVSGLLEATGRNAAQQVKNLKLFEIGKVFIARDPDQLPEEREMLAGLWTGSRTEAAWLSKEIAADFYDIKGVIESLLDALNVPDAAFTALPDGGCRFTRPGHSAEVRIAGQAVGVVGEIQRQVLKNYDLRQTAFVFDLDLERLQQHASEVLPYRPVAKYPAVYRDITLIVDKQLEAGGVLERIRRMHEPLAEDVSLFDVFQEPPIPADKKSVSIRVTYRSDSRTLEEVEVGRVHQSITQRLIDTYDADLPG